MKQQSQLLRSERYAEVASSVNERIHAAAAAFLSPQQMRGLDDMLRRQSELQDARTRMEHAQSEVPGAGQLNIAKSN